MQSLGAKQSNRIVEAKVGFGERGVVENAAQTMDEKKPAQDDDGAADYQAKLGPNSGRPHPVAAAVRHHPESEERPRRDHQQKELREKKRRRVPGHGLGLYQKRARQFSTARLGVRS